MNILFTCVGRRNYLLRYFRESLQEGDKIYATDMTGIAPGMAEADVAIVVPSIYDSEYIPTLLSIIENHRIDALISLNDLEAPILAAARTKIENARCKLLVSNIQVIDITFDKKKTAKFLTSIGLKTPLTYTLKEELDEALSRGFVSFPVVVKPRWGSASIGIEFPESVEELNLVDKLSRLRLQRTILATASGEDVREAMLFQEKICGSEYGLDILNDFQGNYIGTFARKKLAMRAGETDKAETVIIPELEYIGSTISKNLKHIGNLDCDVLERNGEYYVLEMNARFGGGYPFSHEAGAHSTACYVDWLQGKTDVSQHLKYRAGEIYSKCDRLLRVR